MSEDTAKLQSQIVANPNLPSDPELNKHVPIERESYPFRTSFFQIFNIYVEEGKSEVYSGGTSDVFTGFKIWEDSEFKAFGAVKVLRDYIHHAIIDSLIGEGIVTEIDKVKGIYAIDIDKLSIGHLNPNIANGEPYLELSNFVTNRVVAAMTPQVRRFLVEAKILKHLGRFEVCPDLLTDKILLCRTNLLGISGPVYRPAILMNDLSGHASLDKMLEQLANKSIPEKIQEIRDYMANLVLMGHFIDHLNFEGILHRDLKPGNLRLARSGELSTPVVLDYGAGLVNQDTGEWGPTVTLAYCAPELLIQGVDNSKCDIYSMGLVIAEVLSGGAAGIIRALDLNLFGNNSDGLKWVDYVYFLQEIQGRLDRNKLAFERLLGLDLMANKLNTDLQNPLEVVNYSPFKWKVLGPILTELYGANASTQLEKILRSTTHLNPDQRPNNLGEVFTAIKDCLDW